MLIQSIVRYQWKLFMVISFFFVLSDSINKFFSFFVNDLLYLYGSFESAPNIWNGKIVITFRFEAADFE